MTRATGTNWPDILDLIDQGERGRVAGYSAIEPTRCVRRGCRETSADGSGFCRPCLAWVTGETDEDPSPEKPDPTSRPPWSGDYPPNGAAEWDDYFRTSRGSR